MRNSQIILWSSMPNEHPGLLNVLPWNSYLDCVQCTKLSQIFGNHVMLAFFTVCVLKSKCLPLISLLSNRYVCFSNILSFCLFVCSSFRAVETYSIHLLVMFCTALWKMYLGNSLQPGKLFTEWKGHIPWVGECKDLHSLSKHNLFGMSNIHAKLFTLNRARCKWKLIVLSSQLC